MKLPRLRIKCREIFVVNHLLYFYYHVDDDGGDDDGEWSWWRYVYVWAAIWCGYRKTDSNGSGSMVVILHVFFFKVSLANYLFNFFLINFICTNVFPCTHTYIHLYLYYIVFYLRIFPLNWWIPILIISSRSILNGMDHRILIYNYIYIALYHYNNWVLRKHKLKKTFNLEVVDYEWENNKDRFFVLL